MADVSWGLNDNTDAASIGVSDMIFYEDFVRRRT